MDSTAKEPTSMQPLRSSSLLPQLTLTVSPVSSLESSLSEDEDIRPLLSPIVSEPDEIDTHNTTLDKMMLTPGDDEDDFLLRSLKSASFSNANLRFNSRLSLMSSKSNIKSYQDNPDGSSKDVHPYIFNPQNSKILSSNMSLRRSSADLTPKTGASGANGSGNSANSAPGTANGSGDAGNGGNGGNGGNEQGNNHPGNNSRRPSSITESIVSQVVHLKDLTVSQLKRRRFFAVSIFSIICIFIFDLIFLPRTSLDRDLRRLYGGFLTFDDVSRIYISQLNHINDVEKYINIYNDQTHEPGGNCHLMENLLKNFEYLDTDVEKYDVYMGTPIDNSLKLLDEAGELLFEANIKESDQLSYFPFSRNGTVTSEFVYVNYGLDEDYDLLKSSSIDLTTKILIIRINDTHPSLLIEKAQNQKASGIVFYKDPYDDGEYTEKNGYMDFPAGYARNHHAIDKYTGSFIYYQPGDPTTPGWSPFLFEDHKRLNNPDTIPKIPILPISFTEIQPILRKLVKKGPSLNWFGDVLDFDYRPGPSDGLQLSIVNHMDYDIKPIYNIISTIPGIISDEEIIIGSARDVISGQGGVSQGSIGMLEIARGFNELARRNWKPLRTIKLISWDGSSLGQFGSTEFGEYHSQKLINNCIAYINFDNVRGNDLSIESNPLFNKVLRKVMELILLDSNETLGEAFFAKNSTFQLISNGVGDYSVFQNHLGIPSINIGMIPNKEDDPVTYYNSKFDGQQLLKSFDPELKLHNLLAQFIGMLTIELSEHEILNVAVTDYVELIKREVELIVDRLPAEWLDRNMTYPFEYTKLGDEIEILRKQSHDVYELAKAFDIELKNLQHLIIQDFPWFKLYKKIKTAIKVKLYNTRVKALDRMFISIAAKSGERMHAESLLQKRPWFRHIVFAPSLSSPNVSVLPGLKEGFESGDFEQFEMNLVALRIALDRVYKGL